MVPAPSNQEFKFAAFKITIATLNVNGYRRNKTFLHSLCDANPELILGIQEHWLPPPYKKIQGTNILRTTHPDFEAVGTSAMKNKMESSVRKGRPFGGVGFIFPKKYSACIKSLVKYKHDRVCVLEINSNDGPILVINCYCPFFDQNNRENQLVIYNEMMGFIDYVISENTSHRLIVLGDFNCNLYESSHPFTKVVRNFMISHNLIATFDLDPTFDSKISWSRCDVKTSSYTLLDYVLVSNNLSHLTDNVRISLHGDNLSDHSPVLIDMELSLASNESKKQKCHSSILWSKLDEATLSDYRCQMEIFLDSIDVPYCLLIHGECMCLDNEHKFFLEKYHDLIVDCVKKADLTLPRANPCAQKPYWSRELTDLKRLSMEAYDLWLRSGKASSGPNYENMKGARYAYRNCLRREKARNSKLSNDAMYQGLVDKEPHQFWNAWKNLNKCKISSAPRIDGCVNDNDIASAFSETFSNVYTNNDSSAHGIHKQEFCSAYDTYFNDCVNGVISNHYFSWDNMLSVVSKLKPGKCFSGFMKPEHVLHGSPKLMSHLHILFNGMLQHSFVPTDFLRGAISPVVKDNEGDLTSSSNYRPITLCSVFAQMYEQAIRIKIGHLLYSTDLQFGFKKGHSTVHALYTLKTTVNYFTSRSSSVFVAFMDCTKAFDRISHYALFAKLMKRKVPLCFLSLIIFWYLNMCVNCKWNGTFSEYFDVPSGSKQGGILSPEFYSLYVNDLIVLLKRAGLGCHIMMMFLAAILFADDLALLAPSRGVLQFMINICHSYCKMYCLEFNPKKTKVMVFGKLSGKPDLYPLYLGERRIDYVDEWRYLGTTVVSGGKLSFSIQNELRKFYGALNSILGVLVKPPEQISMKLLYSNCVPILSYACGVKDLLSKDMQRMNTAINDGIRKIFSFQRWESTRHLREAFHYPSIEVIFARGKRNLESSLLLVGNNVLSHLYYNFVVD